MNEEQEIQQSVGLWGWVKTNKFYLALGVIIILLMLKTKKGMSPWTVPLIILFLFLVVMWIDRYKTHKKQDLQEDITTIAKQCSEKYYETKHKALDYTNCTADEITPNSKKYGIDYYKQKTLIGYDAITQKMFMEHKFTLPEYQHIKERNKVMSLMAESLRREEEKKLKTQGGIL